MQTTASTADDGGDVYQRLMGQEERVLRTVNRLAAERERQRLDLRDPLLGRSVTALWHDINMTLLGLLVARPSVALRRVYEDPDTQMHLGLALVVAGAVGLLAAACVT